jgi:hypothetical protein
MAPKRLLLTVCALLLLALPMAVAAQEEMVKIVPLPRNNGQVYELPYGTGLYVEWGWAAISPGLVNSFLHTVDQDLTVSGITDPGWTVTVSAEEADLFWGAIIPWSTPTDECLARGHAPLSISRWTYVLGVLPPGEYSLHSRIWTGHPVTDGCVLGDHGKNPDVAPPSEVTTDVTLTIVIEPDE